MTASTPSRPSSHRFSSAPQGQATAPRPTDIVVTRTTVPTIDGHPKRKLRVAEQIVLLTALTESVAYRDGPVYVTLHPDHPTEDAVLSVFQEHNGQRVWPDGTRWSAAQLRRAGEHEHRCPPSEVKRHTLNVTARCSALPSGETLLALTTAAGLSLCFLLAPHLPNLAGKALWVLTAVTLLNLAEHTEHLRGLLTYMLTARIRRCHRPDPRQDDEAFPPEP